MPKVTLNGGGVIIMGTFEIDWKALREQKAYLLDTIENEDRSPDGKHPLDGIVEILDALQDRACEYLGEEAVFGKELTTANSEA